MNSSSRKGNKVGVYEILEKMKRGEEVTVRRGVDRFSITYYTEEATYTRVLYDHELSEARDKSSLACKRTLEAREQALSYGVKK